MVIKYNFQYNTYDDVFVGNEKTEHKSCGGVIKMARDYKIRDRVFYLRLFNRKGIKSHESVMWAGDLEDAEKLYLQVKDTLPKHTTYELGDYYGTETSITTESQI